MAKRELSTTLRNLKFMQRATQREEKPKKEDDGDLKPDGDFLSSTSIKPKCMVIMEGDPRPGAIKGRMSFQSFNPAIDKINDEAENINQGGGSLSAEEASLRENGSSLGGAQCSDTDKGTNEANRELKRKQEEVVEEAKFPNKSPNNVKTDQNQSASSSRSSRKHSKGSKLDWNVLRPQKGQQK